MLPARGLLRTKQSLGLAGAAAFRPSTRLATRQFGTAFRSSNLSLRGTLNTHTPAARRIGGPLAIAAASHARYASTQPAVPDAGIDPLSSAPLPVADAQVTPLDLLDGAELLNIPEQIGFLKALGLDYGWGPTAMMEYVLEHIYIYTGLPWWASIGLTAIAVRALIAKPSVTAMIHTQKVQDLRKDPVYDAASKKMRAMLGSSDKSGMLLARAQMKYLEKQAGYSVLKTMVPMINIPIGYGMFRLIRGMAALPVPSMETGGLLWLPDLTMHDPYFAVPLLTAIFFVSSMRIPIPFMAPDQQTTMKAMGLVMVPLSVACTIYLPAGAQLFFLFSSILQWMQSTVFYTPSFRKMMGLPPLEIGGAPSPSPSSPMGGWQSPRVVDTTAKTTKPTSIIKDGVKAVRDKVEGHASRKEDRNRENQAREYEAKRQLEEKEKLLARREEKARRKRGDQ